MAGPIIQKFFQTRAQRDLVFAERHVTSVLSELEETRKIYGGLCLQFPIFVLTCGLCQALAFSESKAAGVESPRARAHALLLQHVGELLEVKSDPLSAVRQANSSDYRRQSQRLLSAWVYFKRFAVSILKAEADNSENNT